MDLAKISNELNNGEKCRSRQLPKNIIQYRGSQHESQNVHFQVSKLLYFQISIRYLECLVPF